jgi:cell division transport system permease protein
MSGSFDRPGGRPTDRPTDRPVDRPMDRQLATPPLRPSLQRALMQQRQRVEPPGFDDRVVPSALSSRVDGLTPEQPYDPYGYDQYPQSYPDAIGATQYGYKGQYTDEPDEPRTGAPVRVPVSISDHDQSTYDASTYDSGSHSSSAHSSSAHSLSSGQSSDGHAGHYAAPHAASPRVEYSDASSDTPPSRRADEAGSRVRRPARPEVEPPRSSPMTRDQLAREQLAPPQLAPEQLAADDMYAPSRQDAKQRQAGAPIVPAGSVTGRSLTLVISIMCFLACLTAGAVYMMNQSAAAWMRDIASEVTVQIEAKDKVDPEKQLRDVSQFLARQPGIRNVRPLTVGDSAQLLEPWLGQSDALKSLPIPRLIAIEIDRAQPPDLDQIRTQMSAQFKGVSLDDHRHWQQQIRTVTRSFALGGLAILMLVGAATTAIIVSATRSALAANREIVEVLHFVGATDKFIAREFEKHFLRLGIRAGFVGAGSAMLVFLCLPFVMELLGGGTVTIAEIRRMIGTGTLDMAGYILLGIVVIVISALCMLTSRIGVYGILHTQR